MTTENRREEEIAEVLSGARRPISLEELIDLEEKGRVELVARSWADIQRALADEIGAVIPSRLAKDLNLAVGQWHEVTPRDPQKTCLTSLFINCKNREPVLNGALATIIVRQLFHGDQGETEVRATGIHQKTGRIVGMAFNPFTGNDLSYLNVLVFKEEFRSTRAAWEACTEAIPTSRKGPLWTAGFVTKGMVDGLSGREEGHGLLKVCSPTGASGDLAIRDRWRLFSRGPFTLKEENGLVIVSFAPPKRLTLKPWQISLPARLEPVA